MPFEFPPPYTGTGPNVTLLDPGGNPVNIIRTVDTFTIRVEWSLDLPAASLLGGDWLVRAYAEFMGPGQEQQLGGTVQVNVAAGTPTATTIDFRGDVVVVPPHLEAEGPASSGVYKLVVIVTHQNIVGGTLQPTVLAGFSEADFIQMRNP